MPLYVQASNSKHGITGRLLYYHGTRNVQQVLEGPEEAVMGIWEKIRKDPRHTLVSETVLNVVEREFSNFMALDVVHLDQRKTRTKTKRRQKTVSQAPMQ